MYSVNIWKETVFYDKLVINEWQKKDKEYSVLLDGIRRGFQRPSHNSELECLVSLL